MFLTTGMQNSKNKTVGSHGRYELALAFHCFQGMK